MHPIYFPRHLKISCKLGMLNNSSIASSGQVLLSMDYPRGLRVQKNGSHEKSQACLQQGTQNPSSP